MTVQPIATHIHLLREAVTPANFLGASGPADERDADALRALNEAPVYCLDADVLALMADKGSYDSVAALFRAGLGNRLPYPELILELGGQRQLYILLAEEKTQVTAAHPQTGIDCTVDGDFVARIITAGETMLDGERVLDVCIEPGLFVVEAGKPGRPNMLTGVRPDGFDRTPDAATVRQIGSNIQVVKLAIKALLLAMVTDGIGQHVVEAPEAVNRARLRKGKAPIPRHVVIHISHCTDRNGVRRSVGSGRHVRLHWRAGHIRQQPCGEGRRQRKAIFIAPVLINYAPDTKRVPAPAMHVLRVRP